MLLYLRIFFAIGVIKLNLANRLSYQIIIIGKTDESTSVERR